jgi:tetrapyrrole methylase family protein/MazG family protein
MAGRLIKICGLGPGDWEAVPVGVVETLRQAGIKFLRTEKHPVVPYLRQMGIVFETFDRFYEEGKSADTASTEIAAAVLDEAAKDVGQVIYAVPGHPLVFEEPSRLIVEGARSKGIAVRILPAMSFLDAVYDALGLNPAEGLTVLDGLHVDTKPVSNVLPVILTRVSNKSIAAKVQHFLLERYPGSHKIKVISAAGVRGEEKRAEIPVCELDGIDWLDRLTTVYIPPLACLAGDGTPEPGSRTKSDVEPAGYWPYTSVPRHSVAPLVDIIETLRGERGCPWDREQTHESLKKYLIEEAYEVLEAIEHGKPHNLCEELGDLLLQIVFHCQIASEAGQFHLGDVVETITEKMLYRHPHVFGQVRVRDSEEVRVNWERLKKAEEPGRRTFEGIPRSLPALLRATRVQEKASRLGFDWETWQGALTKVQEETAELLAAAEASEGVGGELGDLVFAVVNVARQLGLDAEELLNKTTEKFINRFTFIEERAREKGVELGKLDLAQMDSWWEEAKKLEAGS